MKRGFTLVEVLATIALLGLLVAIVYPKVLERVEEQQTKIDNKKKELIYSSTEEYIEDNKETYRLRSGKIYCIDIKNLDKYLTTDTTDIEDEYIVKVIVTSEDNISYNLVKTDKCSEN